VRGRQRTRDDEKSRDSHREKKAKSKSARRREHIGSRRENCIAFLFLWYSVGLKRCPNARGPEKRRTSPVGQAKLPKVERGRRQRKEYTQQLFWNCGRDGVGENKKGFNLEESVSLGLCAKHETKNSLGRPMQRAKRCFIEG